MHTRGQTTSRTRLPVPRAQHGVERTLWPATTLTISFMEIQRKCSYLPDELKFLFWEVTKRQHLWACTAEAADSEVGTEALNVVILLINPCL